MSAKLACALAALCTAAFTPPLAYAQAPDAGSILRQQQPPADPAPSTPAPALRIDEPARPALRDAPGVRFVLKGLRISGQTVFTQDELLALVQPLVGTEVGLVDLEQAAARISRYYRQRGYVVARAWLPAQELRGGVVEIAVLEGRIGRIVIDNQSRVRPEVIEARMAGLAGRVVLDTDIDARLWLVYELAGIGPAPQAMLQPGANVGEADLVLQLPAERLASASLEYDNHGNRFTGSNRLSAQLNLHSPTGNGDLLSARVTQGDPELSLYRLSYQLPASAIGLRLGAEYSHVRYRLGRAYADLQANGSAGTWLAFASHPLLLGRNYSAHVRLSVQHNTIQDRIDSTSTVTDKTSRLATLAITGDWRDSFAGGGAGAASIGLGVGELDIRTPAARTIDELSARTNGSFRKWNASVTRLQRLTGRASMYFLAAGQKASRNLDSSEKFILGGPHGVKAYPQGEAPGDSGYLLNAELRYTLAGNWPAGQTQLLAFADTGRVTVNEAQYIPGVSRRRLSSAGLGVAWLGQHGTQLRLMAAHKLGNASATSDHDQAMRVWVQLVQRF